MNYKGGYEIEDKLNLIFRTAWEQKIELKGIVLDKKHKKQVNKISGHMGEATIFCTDFSQLATVIYQ